MKAAVLFKANTPLEIVDLEQQGPRRPARRACKVKAAGICHSDWHIMNGDWHARLCPWCSATRRRASSRRWARA